MVSDNAHLPDLFLTLPSNHPLDFFFIFTLFLVHIRFSTAPNMLLRIALSFYPQKTQRTSGRWAETTQHASSRRCSQDTPPGFTPTDKTSPNDALPWIPLLLVSLQFIEALTNRLILIEKQTICPPYTANVHSPLA